MPSDIQLLRQYAEHKDAAAFAEVVRRQADFVHSVAWRVTANAALAQDVAQAVFTKLALHPGKLLGHDTLAGWLHTTARREAINAIRGEVRRRVREQEVAIMQTNSSAPDPDWERLRPLIDEALDSLREGDRKAILLRFFQGLSHHEVGSVLGLNDEAARKRVDRALEKLRACFARRGVLVSSRALAASLSLNSVQTAPAGLAAILSGNALAAGTAASAGWFGALLTSFLAMTTLAKTAITAAIIIAVAIPAYQFWPGAGGQSLDPVAVKPAWAPDPVLDPPPEMSPDILEPPPEAPANTPEPAPAVATDTGDPRVVIHAAMDAYASLLEAGDYATAAETYMQLPPNMTGRQLVESLQKNADFPDTVKMLIEATRAAQTETPEYNDTGDLATYKLSQPTDGKTMVRWKKINGIWYVDAFE